MNRDIIFRAKCFGNWRYGSYVHFVKKPTNSRCNINYKDFIITNEDNGEHYFPISDLSSLGQYTGLKDKNGKQIFEGDILEYIGERKDNMNKVYHRKVVFYEGAFCLSIEDGVHYPVHTPMYGHSDNHNIVNWDVVGNITDNPELMK